MVTRKKESILCQFVDLAYNEQATSLLPKVKRHDKEQLKFFVISSEQPIEVYSSVRIQHLHTTHGINIIMLNTTFLNISLRADRKWINYQRHTKSVLVLRCDIIYNNNVMMWYGYN